MYAANRRAMLANAHAKYFRSHHNADARLALEKVLVEAKGISPTESIVDIHMDSTTICITLDNTFEVLELDAYGNVLRGAV